MCVFITSVTAKWMQELPGAEHVSACLEGLPLGVGLSGHLTNTNKPDLVCRPSKDFLLLPAPLPHLHPFLSLPFSSSVFWAITSRA